MPDNQRMLTDISVKVGRLEAMQENTTKSIEDMQRTTSESIKELTYSISELVRQLKDTDDASKNAINKVRPIEFTPIDGLLRVIKPFV